MSSDSSYYFSIAKSRYDADQSLVKFESLQKTHYVYILHRPDGSPFYVGKGQEKRVFFHEAEARKTSRLSHKLNVIRKILKSNQSVLYSIPAAFQSNEEALDEERRLIRLIGRYDINNHFPLTNQTDGGEGTLNLSEESKEKHRQTLAGPYADDPDVAAANVFFAKFCEARSTPIKSTKKFKDIRELKVNRDYIEKTPRNAGALIAMAFAQSVFLQSGAVLTRRFSVNGVEMILENGCGRDMLVNGMIELKDDTPKFETIIITKEGIECIMKNHSKDELISFGLLSE